MIPLSVPNINGNEWQYVKDCLDTGWISSAGAYVTKFEEAIDNTYFKGGEGEWASLDALKDNFVEALRSLYNQWQTDRTILTQHGIITAQHFTWLNTT